MPSRERRGLATALSFTIAIGLLFGLVNTVGTAEVLAVLLLADRIAVGALVLTVFCWIATWSGSLWVTLGVFDLPDPPVRTYLAYTSMMFWDNVTPVSTIAADPVSAGVLSRAFDTEYERSLAVVVAVDFLNFVPSPFIAALGLVVVASTVAFGGVLERTASVLLVALLVLIGGSCLLWRYRRPLSRTIAGLSVPTERRIRRYVPGLDEQAEVTVHDRVERLLEYLERIAGRRRTLATIISLAVAGWMLLAFSLWLSLYAVSVVLPIGVTLLAVPLVTVVELAPLPGGVGGLEPLLVLLLGTTTGAPLATLTAGVLLFRLGTHALPIVIGGAAHPLLVYRPSA